MTYSYDDLNRLETVVDPATGTTRYTYDTVGNLHTVSYPNGTRAEYTYDLLNRLTLLENRGSDGSLISSYAYTLDAAGNRTKVEEEPSGRVVDYVYDSTNRLLSESITEPGKDDRILTYTYDKVGNRLTKTENGFTTTYEYDANNRLRKEDDVTYSYDDNGNLIEKQSAEEQIVYEYDYDNRLTRVETSRYNATIVVEYEYDAEGNRVRKTIDGNVVINYLVDTNRDYAQVVEERDSDGNLLVRYVYGHDLISQTRPSAGSGTVTSYYHYDGLGSTRELSSSAGIVTDSYSYDAFGLLLEQAGTTENAYRYRGEQFDEELGFYYLRARYMDPNVGRFVTMDEFAGLSQDPVTLHKYLYANANPVTYSDPSGYFSFNELNVSTTIRGVLSRVGCFARTALKRAVIGGLFGAITGGIDAWLGGDDIFEGIGNGAVYGAAFGGLSVIRVLQPIITGLGLYSSLRGVYEAVEQKNHKQALFRSVSLILAVKGMLSKTWRYRACFTEDTLIYTRNGYTKIKDIKVGDEVYSENVETGEKGVKLVKQVFVKETHSLIHIFIRELEIRATPDHPFWVEGKGWTSANRLKRGDKLRLYSNKYVEITSIEREEFTKALKVYNFEVEDWHTYFIASENILVHNSDCGGSNLPNKGSSAYKALFSLLKRFRNVSGNKTVNKKTLTSAEADFLGKRWVGDNYKTIITKKGVIMYLSKDGLRKYRGPSLKKTSPYTKTGSQANFERRASTDIPWQSADNAHIDVFME